MSSAKNFATAAATIFLQATTVTILSMRVSCSPINSSLHAHMSFFSKLRVISAATYCLWASFVAAWIYTVVALLLQVGLDSARYKNCNYSFFFCAYMYLVAKFPVYLYLIERAHVVRGLARRQDRIYMLNLLILGLFAVIFIFPARCMCIPSLIISG